MIIAQLSDIHAATDNDNLSRFERALVWLDRVEPDALVLTGDLTDDSWREGYESISAQLKRRSYPAFILPGNSDNRTLMRSVWGDGCRNDASSATAARHFVADLGELRLIGVDAALAGSPAGSITEHLPWLNKTLSAEGPETSLLFLHHHVFQSGIPTMDHIMCRDAVKLSELLQKNSRRPIAIATGHVHRPMVGNLAGIPAYICGSICPANPLWFGSERVPPANDPPSMMIHRFADGELVSHHISI